MVLILSHLLNQLVCVFYSRLTFLNPPSPSPYPGLSNIPICHEIKQQPQSYAERLSIPGSSRQDLLETQVLFHMRARALLCISFTPDDSEARNWQCPP